MTAAISAIRPGASLRSRFRRVEHVMGLPVSLDVRDDVPGVADVAESMYVLLREVDARFSPFRPDSEVSRYARGEVARPSPDLAEILGLCERYERASAGAFSPWLPGRSFDPCGVVKGWAVARAGELLREAGLSRFCINAGGDVLTAGEPEPGRPWQVGIRHPHLPHQLCAVLGMRDGAVATSGTYERGQHIVDGRTGQPAVALLSLTVVASDMTLADATATAAFAMGRDGIAWAATRPGCQLFAVDKQDRVYRSPDLETCADFRR